VLQQELKGGKRLIDENEDFVAFTPFASRFPFEMSVFPKFHSSAFIRIGATQIENLAGILRNVLGSWISRWLDRLTTYASATALFCAGLCSAGARAEQS
jgi:galactose-1-phosphate uridylyltransferase